MSPEYEPQGQGKSLPPPWDRIFSLGTRLFVWALLLATLWLLRPFFLLIFLTFVFAYIQAHAVDGLRTRVPNRPLRVTIVGLVFLGTITATVLTLTPRIQEQAQTVLENHREYIDKADDEINAKLRQYPQLWAYVTKMDEAAAAAAVRETPRIPGEEEAPHLPAKEPRFVKSAVDALLGLGGVEGSSRSPQDLLRRWLDVGSSVLGYLSSFLLSLLFSFLIVLDMPKLKRAIAGLADTKIGFIYDEVAENLATFGMVLGRALEAQLFIAVCNTILTATGMIVLGIENVLVLSAIVFLCSFIPVAGVFISSTPICLLALQESEGGFGLMLLTIGMILVVHAIETYILNPRIYGHHMRMNPVLVLIVLTISGKLFGIWGLVLGIPIVNYFFRHAIRYPKDQPLDVAA